MVAIGLTVVLTLLLIISLMMMVLESVALEYMRQVFHASAPFLLVLSILNWLFSIFLVYTGISLIYHFGPSMHRRIPFVNVGSMIATAMSLITSLGFSYFINNFGRYNEIYGSIGALIVMMIWIQVNSFIMLVGFELNASVVVYKNTQKRLHHEVNASPKGA